MLRSNAAGTHDWFPIHDTHLSDKEGRWVGHFSRGRSTLVAPMLLTPHDDNWLACVLHALVFDRHDRLTPAPAGGDLQNSSDTLPATWSTWSAVCSLMYPGSVAKKRGKSGRTEGSG